MSTDALKPTPLTDATKKLWKNQIRVDDEIWDFARTLERRNAELLQIAQGLMKECYSEANRLANHGSCGLEKLVMNNLYDAANTAKAEFDKLNANNPQKSEA